MHDCCILRPSQAVEWKDESQDDESVENRLLEGHAGIPYRD